MDAKEFCNALRNSEKYITLEHFDEHGQFDGNASGVVIDQIEQMAIILRPPGKQEIGIGSGAIVKFHRHPEATHARIVGSPGYLEPTMVGNVKFGKLM